jgi:hypothetical protein
VARPSRAFVAASERRGSRKETAFLPSRSFAAHLPRTYISPAPFSLDHAHALRMDTFCRGWFFLMSSGNRFFDATDEGAGLQISHDIAYYERYYVYFFTIPGQSIPAKAHCCPE